MAKGAYVGVDNASHKIKNLYVGVDNIPHKVVKGYVGVNGVPKQFWPSIYIPNLSWNYWTSVSKVLFTTENWDVVKPRNKIAYYGIAWCNATIGDYMTPILISPDADAVRISYGVGTYEYPYEGTIRDSNGITWYYNGGNGVFWDTTSTELLLNTRADCYTGIEQAAQDLLEKIYTTPFQEEYQIGQNWDYTDLVLADTKVIIKNAIGIFLYFFNTLYDSAESIAYKTLSDNADNIINYIANTVGSDFFYASIDYNEDLRNGVLINFNYHTTNNERIIPLTTQIESPYNNRRHHYTMFGKPNTTNIPTDRSIRCAINSLGEINWSTYTHVGFNGIGIQYNTNYRTINFSNLGLAPQMTPSPTQLIRSWRQWVGSSGTITYALYPYISKKSGGIAYFGLFHDGSTPQTALIISTNKNMANITVNGTDYEANNYIIDTYGVQWWYSYSTVTILQDYPGRDIISPNILTVGEAARAIVDNIYSVSFTNNYVMGNAYTLYATSIEETIKKVVSTALHKNTNLYDSNNIAYKTFSHYALTIIGNVMERIRNKGDERGLTHVMVRICPDNNDSFVLLEVCHGTVANLGQNVDHIDNLTFYHSSGTSAYPHFEFKNDNDEYGVYPDWEESVDIDNNGNITYNTYDGMETQISDIGYNSGIYMETLYGCYDYHLTNLGVNL